MTITTVQAGYKMTEIGVIPEDWEVKELNEILSSTRLGGNYQNTEKETSYPLIKMGNIGRGDIVLDKLEYIPENQNIKSGDKLRRGDVLFNTRNTLDLVGKVAIWRDELPSAYYNSNLLRLDFKKEYVSSNFLINYIFNTKQSIQQLKGFATGTTSVAAIYTRDLLKFKITLPTTTEQQAIATVLSDTDELIRSLSALITKKRQIKEGAMQELLTGKKRLAGFSGEWEVKKLGKICGNITTGKLDANAMIENGEYRFYTCAKEYYRINDYAFDTEALLVSGNGANVGYIHYYKGKFNAYQRTYVLFNFSEDIHFIKVFMDRNLQERIRVEVNAGNTPYITMGTLTEMEINIPPTKEEQQAIAEILSDMDNEITALEEKREKYRLIKQGMMQQLLTGKIRLI